MIWLNWLIFLILIAGHTEFQVMLINRVHSQRLQRNVLRHLEHLHELFILAFPPWLIWFAGFHGPRLLSGGRWSAVDSFWATIFGICGLGFLSQVNCAIRWNTRRTPATVSPKSSQVFDIADRLGEMPVGSGAGAFLARLPGNQVFETEFVHKELQLPRLPAVWDGLSILQLTDWHLHGSPDRRFYEEIVREAERLNPDLIVFTGDLLDDMACLDWLPRTLGRLKAPLGQFSILGNHDWLLAPPTIRKRMEEIGWRDVGSHSLTIFHRDRPLVIGGTERPWMGQHPDFAATDDSTFRLLLSHTPDNFSWAQKNGVDLMLSGHNHGGQIVLPVIGPMYTPSLYGVRYSSGAWHQNGTLLYVSRGISGGHPIRYNCRPEVSLLTLRSVRAEAKATAQQGDHVVPAQSPLARNAGES